MRIKIFILLQYLPKDNLTVILFTNLTGCTPEEIIEKITKCYIPDLGN